MEKKQNSRKIQAQATRKKIFDTAKELFGKYGFEAVTVDQITHACGIAKGTFYHHFKSKDDLIVNIERAPYADIADRLAKLGSLPMEERLYKYILYWFELMDKDDVTFTSQWMKQAVDLNSKTFFEADDTKMDFDMKMIRDIFMDGIADGTLRGDTPTDVLAKEILFSMQGSAVYRCIRRGQFQVMEWAETFAKLVLDKYVAPYRRDIKALQKANRNNHYTL